MSSAGSTLCIANLKNVLMEMLACREEGVTRQGEMFLCEFMRAVGVHICQTAGCKVQVLPGFGAACHLVSKQQLFVEGRRD